MNLLEYQAKSLLRESGVAVPSSRLVKSGETFTEGNTAFPIVLKSQVPVGGRGKAGGIKTSQNAGEAQNIVANLFKLPIKGHLPHAVLAEEALQIKQEYYLSITIDRASQSIAIFAHPEGGVEIESADQQKLLKINDTNNLRAAAQKIIQAYGLSEAKLNNLQEILVNLVKALSQNDALLIEINPLVLTKNDAFVAADAKIVLDNAALFRHADWKEFEAPASANFVTLNEHGNVAAMANGAGLAMATVDAIKANGLEPANFLDVGGGASTESMLTAFNQITSLPNVRAIIINIFAGITRCDEVARAIVEAKKLAEVPPLFIRLYGTNKFEGEVILQNAGIQMHGSLEECIKEASRAVA
jgi:succinyl-CoA synthetase beta subunit